jgi:hypothetical protein
MSTPDAHPPLRHRVLETADRFFFLKKGYAFLSHIVPFGVASLLLLTLSLPTDNLLVKLEKHLSARDSLAIPALLLTAVALGVYLFSVRTQVRRAYLDARNQWLRTLITSTVFLALATLMAWLVLDSEAPLVEGAGWEARIGRAWACVLVALLSLTGIGWTTPATWHERVGVEVPDYRKARGAIAAIATQHLEEIREVEIGTPSQRDALHKAFEDLGSELRQNRRLEPQWAIRRVDAIAGAVAEVASRVKDDFGPDPNGSESNVADLPAVLRGEKTDIYQAFHSAFTTVQAFFPEWIPPRKPASTMGGAS